MLPQPCDLSSTTLHPELTKSNWLIIRFKGRRRWKSAVGTEGTSVRRWHWEFWWMLMLNTTALQSMLFVPLRKRSVKNQFFFLVVSFTTTCIDRVNGKKTGKRRVGKCRYKSVVLAVSFNPYPTAFPYGNGMILHFYQQQESSTTKTVHKVINKRLKTYV